MKTLIPILFLSLLFASQIEKITRQAEKKRRRRHSVFLILYFSLLLLTLALPIGLRRIYNDTGAYIYTFIYSPYLKGLIEYGDLHLLHNPAFSLYTALMRTLTDNYHVYFMIPALFVQGSFIAFLYRYCKHFTLGVGLYICLGTYVFSFAAMKQTIAMAFLLLAIPFLLKKKYIRYFLLVFIAFLFHTYAIAFAILPLLAAKPWKLRTYLLLIGTLFIMWNFEGVIGTFLDYANENGKHLAEYEVFDNAQVNIFRVSVYAVVPILSFLLRNYLFRGEYSKEYALFTHMSILSFAFMLLGTISGANMFARMASYFETGMICALPWVLHKALDRQTARIVTAIACICFLVYFVYANEVAHVFSDHYRAITLLEFLQSLFE